MSPDSTRWQLTRHLYLEASSDVGLIAHNALQRSHVALTNDQWRCLADHQLPTPANPARLAEPLFRQLTDAQILVNGSEQVDLIGQTSRLVFQLLGQLSAELGLSRPQLDRLMLHNQGFPRGSEAAYRARLTAAQSLFSALNQRHRAALEGRFDAAAIATAHRYVLGVFDCPGSLLEQLRRDADTPYRQDSELCLDFMHCPPNDYDLEQQPCMPACSAWRADRIQRDFPEGARVLVLGDDDLIGLALAPLGHFQIAVAELDDRLLSVISEARNRRQLSNLAVQRVDLRDGLPDSLRGRFDVVVTDPPYMSDGMAAFIATAAQALDPQSTLRKLYLSTNPSLLEAPRAFFETLAAHQFVVHQRHRQANFYRRSIYWLRRVVDFLGEIGYPTRGFDAFDRCPYLYADFFEALPLKSVG